MSLLCSTPHYALCLLHTDSYYALFILGACPPLYPLTLLSAQCHPPLHALCPCARLLYMHFTYSPYAHPTLYALCPQHARPPVHARCLLSAPLPLYASYLPPYTSVLCMFTAPAHFPLYSLHLPPICPASDICFAPTTSPRTTQYNPPPSHYALCLLHTLYGTVSTSHLHCVYRNPIVPTGFPPTPMPAPRHLSCPY